MGHHEHAQAHGPAEFSKQGKDRLTTVLIQITSGLIGKKQGRFQDQGPGQGHPLLFTTGQLCRAMIQPMRQADLVKEITGPIPYFFIRSATDPARHHDIFQGGKFRQKMMELKDKADITVAMVGQLFFLQAEQGLASKEKFPRIRRIQGTENLQQSGFAGTRSANNGIHLALMRHQVNPAQHLHPARTLTKPLSDPPGYQQWILIHS